MRVKILVNVYLRSIQFSLFITREIDQVWLCLVRRTQAKLPWLFYFFISFNKFVVQNTCINCSWTRTCFFQEKIINRTCWLYTTWSIGFYSSECVFLISETSNFFFYAKNCCIQYFYIKRVTLRYYTILTRSI